MKRKETLKKKQSIRETKEKKNKKPPFSMRKKNDLRQFLLILEEIFPNSDRRTQQFSYKYGYIIFTVKQRD